jgi:sugar/nucleoside kinase (ribokinase family)
MRRRKCLREIESSCLQLCGKKAQNKQQKIECVVSVRELFLFFQSDGRTHETIIKTCAGGVGRNVAEALQKLGHDPLLISCIGDDLFGRELLRHFKQIQMVSIYMSIYNNKKSIRK